MICYSTRWAFGERIPNHIKAPMGLCLALALIGCNGGSPTAPSASPGPSAPTGSVPAVSGLSVTVGSTGGGTRVTLTGSNLDRGAIVRLGGVAVTSNGYDPRLPTGTSLSITTPAHAAGVVDVVITNPNGQQLRLDNSYEFVEPDSFDFNGSWSGVSIDGQDVLVEFVVTNNRLSSAECRYFEKTTAVLSTQVTNGTFLAEGPDGFRLSGRIVSAGQATGRLSAPGCVAGDTLWHASKVN